MPTKRLKSTPLIILESNRLIILLRLPSLSAGLPRESKGRHAVIGILLKASAWALFYFHGVDAVPAVLFCLKKSLIAHRDQLIGLNIGAGYHGGYTHTHRDGGCNG